MYIQSSKTVTHQPQITVKCLRFEIILERINGFDENDKSHVLDIYDDNQTAERAYELIYDHLAAGDHKIKMSDIRKKLGLST